MNLAILSRAAAYDKHKLASTAPWLLLVDFNWNGQHVRFVRNTNAVTFDAGDGMGVQTYSPYNFEITGAESTLDGSLPPITLKASNVNRILEGALVHYSGAAGAVANIYVVNTDNPSGEPELAIQATIVRASPSPAWVTFTLSAASPLRMLFPKYTYNQGGCMWQYKGAQCGYGGSLSTCDLTFSGTNGCIAHGNQVRFGGFPGVGSNGASIAGQV